MVEARLPEDETERLAILHAYGVLDTETEATFDRVARLAKRLCGTPIALVTLVDEERQWFKACLGVEHRETDRVSSFCAHAILEPDEVTHIPDALEDERTADNPLVTGGPGYRFYAGAPIVTPNGHALGTVCVLDHEPRELDQDQLAALEDLADQAAELLEERYAAARAQRQGTFLGEVLDAMPEHVAILDASGDIIATNEAWDAFARAQRGSPGPGPNYLLATDATGSEEVRAAREGIEALLEGRERSFELEYPRHGPDEERWFRLTARAFEDGGDRYVVVAHRDIGAERAARRAVEASERQFREVAEHLDVVSWLISADLEDVYYVSPAFEAVFQRSRDAFYEAPRKLLDWIHQEDREQVMNAFTQVVHGVQDVRYRILVADGSTRTLESRGFPVLDEHGEVDRIAGITRDVTAEEWEQQIERRRTREMARGVELEQMVFATSHNLRSAVRRIRSFSQLLEQRIGPDLDDQVREPLEQILEGSSNLDALHTALRRYAEATQGPGAHEMVDLAGIAREVLAERSAEIEGPGGGSVVGEIAPVAGDPEQLRILLAELVDNAVKFRSDPPVELSIETTDRGETVEVHVRDNGRGFDPAYAERIFSIFQQLEPATTEGVGIGLTICRRIVENHGGTIHADADPGKGATFTFTLPKAPPG